MMTESNILFDVLSDTTGVGGTVFSIVLSLVFPALLLFFGVRGFRRSEGKAGKTISMIVFIVGLTSLITGIVALFMDPLAAEYRQSIESRDYSEIQGSISNLTESTLCAGNPAATFEVNGHVFEYARGSENYELNMVEKGGFLANGLGVIIWFRDDKILRVFTMNEQRSKDLSNNQIQDIGTNAPNPDL